MDGHPVLPPGRPVPTRPPHPHAPGGPPPGGGNPIRRTRSRTGGSGAKSSLTFSEEAFDPILATDV
ncbi:hypothetical protein ACFPM0_13700 [Pseudonocardia sulfidoxydans]|uniref:hypothetical protein n=1 Tax=Pseudonocardia sulfidoxydans TaxID=54011 RepID=UPI00360B4485